MCRHTAGNNPQRADGDEVAHGDAVARGEPSGLDPALRPWAWSGLDRNPQSSSTLLKGEVTPTLPFGEPSEEEVELIEDDAGEAPAVMGLSLTGTG